MEHQQQFEFQQDPVNLISDEQIKQRMLQAYLCLYPIYEDQKNILILKTLFAGNVKKDIFGKLRQTEKETLNLPGKY